MALVAGPPSPLRPVPPVPATVLKMSRVLLPELTDLITARSATPTTVVVMETVLLAESGSVSSEVTATVLVAVPSAAAWGTTTITTEAVASRTSSPRLQVTVPLSSEQALPWEGVAEVKVTLAGRVSVTTVPEASEGPLLVTLMV